MKEITQGQIEGVVGGEYTFVLYSSNKDVTNVSPVTFTVNTAGEASKIRADARMNDPEADWKLRPAS